MSERIKGPSNFNLQNNDFRKISKNMNAENLKNTILNIINNKYDLNEYVCASCVWFPEAILGVARYIYSIMSPLSILKPRSSKFAQRSKKKVRILLMLSSY